ncbi:DNA-3-methyladenine glycosylase [bacterium]|nr:MAG: DNA-3-methyladenine glycosylase [bacterium]
MRAVLERDVLEASQRLLGCILVHGPMRARIVETEGYRAEDDPACHAYRKTTMRNAAMFGPPGRAYVYLNYGMHWMLNVSAHPNGQAAAVLIRAAEPLEGLERMRENRGVEAVGNLLSGPGKLCRAFGIDRGLNDIDLLDPSSELRIESAPPPGRILTGPRIGLAIGKAHDFPWRYVDADRIEWASRPIKDLR